MKNKYSFGSIWLSVNYKCNNKCKWCYAEEQINHEKFDMNPDFAKKSINLIKEINAAGITLIGGEPTLYPHLEEILKYAKSKDVPVGMVSNGRKFHDKAFLKKIFEAGLTGVAISINGSSSDTHEKITCAKNSFEETLTAIKNCKEAGYKFTTETTICKENKDELEKILDMLYCIGVEQPQLNICTRSIDRDNESTLTVSENAKIRENLYKYAKDRGKKLRFIIPLPFCAYDEEVRDKMHKDKVIYNSCQIYTGKGFVIDYNGDVLPCVRWSGYPLGNIVKQNSEVYTKEEFLDFWQNKDPKKFREKLLFYPSEKCAKDNKNWGDCRGGCPMIWLKYDATKEITGAQ